MVVYDSDGDPIEVEVDGDKVKLNVYVGDEDAWFTSHFDVLGALKLGNALLKAAYKAGE